MGGYTAPATGCSLGPCARGEKVHGEKRTVTANNPIYIFFFCIISSFHYPISFRVVLQTLQPIKSWCWGFRKGHVSKSSFIREGENGFFTLQSPPFGDLPDDNSSVSQEHHGPGIPGIGRNRARTFLDNNMGLSLVSCYMSVIPQLKMKNCTRLEK